MQISSVTRGAGRRATAAAAYRAGERVRDERSGELFNYSRRRDVLHTEIFLPAQFDGVTAAWARNRERLWNTAEHAEKRHNARVAREYQVTLPAELDSVRRVALARTYAQEIAERYKVAVDLAVHAPRPDGDPRNFHAHLLTTTREVTPAGLGAKAGLDLHPRERLRRALPDSRQEFVALRERWATLTNQALREANIDARIDHRSLAAQGIDREPLPAIPLMHLKMEQRGLRSSVAERIRDEYRDRVARRLARTTTEDRSAAPAAERTAPVPQADVSAENRDVQEIRRQAREAWLQLRSKEQSRIAPQSLQQAQGSEREAPQLDTVSRSAQDDLAL